MAAEFREHRVEPETLRAENLPETVGDWSFKMSRNGRGEVIGVEYNAVVSTGERALACAHECGVGDEWTGYAGFQEPCQEEYRDFHTIQLTDSLPSRVSRPTALRSLSLFVDAVAPSDIVGTHQTGLADFGGVGE